jgi:hypothetical protein
LSQSPTNRNAVVLEQQTDLQQTQMKIGAAQR